MTSEAPNEFLQTLSLSEKDNGEVYERIAMKISGVVVNMLEYMDPAFLQL